MSRLMKWLTDYDMFSYMCFCLALFKQSTYKMLSIYMIDNQHILSAKELAAQYSLIKWAYWLNVA